MPKIKALFNKHPFGSILFVLAIVVGIQIIKPQYDFAGWDNYSSYLDVSQSLYKTFFSTWREYRGFGTPSDSEVTDFPRLIVLAILSLVFKNNLLDQIYWALSLISGVLAMYIFSCKLFQMANYTSSKRILDILGAISGFFYLFNLNTLGVFYFPIFPYTPRFFALPLLALAFLLLLAKDGFNRKNVVISTIIFFVCLPSYIIGTVFVTAVIGLGIFSIFQSNIKRIMAVFTFFLLFNSFWILPFVNYTIQKSAIIRVAPTFINANELQLNKPKEFYQLYNQLVLLPNFFETEFSSIENNEQKHLHPIANITSNPLIKGAFLIFPFFYLLGTGLILYNYKKHKRLLWVPTVISLFIFLSMKEFSWLGFVYAFLNKYVPLFGVLFRFGDTKLHPLIAFAGSISAALAVIEILKYAKNIKNINSSKLVYGALILGLVLNIGLFYNYFIGNTVGFFTYNKIPDAYRNIAQIINEDPGDGRVIHLPYNNIVYWRSYSWGYLGSHFFGYMLNKPLLEKTFEPASMENAYINEKIYQQMNNSQGIESTESMAVKANSLYETLKLAGVKHVVLDETVAIAIPTRGTVFWGNFNLPDTKELINAMTTNGLLRRVRTEEVALADYLDTYNKEFELSQDRISKIKESESKKITLYEVKDSIERIFFSTNTLNVDPEFDSLLESNLIPNQKTIVQDSTKPAYVFPFKRPDSKVDLRSDNSNIHIKLGSKDLGNLIGINNNVLETASSSIVSNNESYLINVMGKRIGNTITLSFYHQPYPGLGKNIFKNKLADMPILFNQNLNNSKHSNLEQYASDWHVLNFNETLPLRVKVENTTLPIPTILDENEFSIGSVIVHNKSFSIEAFQFSQFRNILTNQLQETENPNCYGDAIKDFSHTFNNNDDGTSNLYGKNGSTCVWRSLGDLYNTGYLELVMDVEGSNRDIDINKHSTSKPILKEVITSLPKPLSYSVCIKESAGSTCLNKHNLVKVNGRQTIIFPTDIVQETLDTPLVLQALRNIGNQEMNLTIHSMGVNSYRSISKKDVNIVNNSDIETTNTNLQSVLDNGLGSTLVFPKPISKYSYYHNPVLDSFLIPTEGCNLNNGYSTHRILDNKWLTYLENCQNQVYITLPFSSNNFLMWSLNYNLGSGQFPRYVLRDTFYEYSDTLVSQYQGYPDIEGFKQFQNPEYLTIRENEMDKLRNTKTIQSHQFMITHPEYRDIQQKDYRIYQYSENEGLLAIEYFDVVELPTAWEELYIGSSKANNTYNTPKELKYKKIIPSLWKVELTQNTTDTEYLLVFNEGFDKQWKAYSSISEVIFGSQSTFNHARCNGIANCFEIPVDYSVESQTIYIFYTPERIYFFGWIITLTTIIGTLFITWRKKSTDKTFNNTVDTPIEISREYPTT